MIGFLTALWANPWVRKAIIYGAIALAALYALRLYGNRQWSKGEQAGRQAGLADAEKVMAERQSEMLRAIAAEKMQLSASQAAIAAERAEAARARAAISNTLSNIIRASEAAKDQTDAVVDRIPGDELDAAIRSQSAKLAAAQ